MTKGRPPTDRSPQEKKALSYEKDRRNTYGERGAKSRFAIADSKAIAHRLERREANRALDRVNQVDESVAEVIQSDIVKGIHKDSARARFKKAPDEPLSAVVPKKLARRVLEVNAKSRRRASRLPT